MNSFSSFTTQIQCVECANENTIRKIMNLDVLKNQEWIKRLNGFVNYTPQHSKT